MNSDEAVVGLMARAIIHGNFSAFYWGQNYGGGEPYLVALFFAIFGPGNGQLQAAVIFLSAVSGVLTWRVARRLVGASKIGVLAGVVVFAAPEVFVWNSTMELGFRGVTMVCGLAAVLFALRIFQGRRGVWEFIGLGVVAGVGWWSSPEILYFIVPCALLLVSTARHDPGRAMWTRRAIGGLAGAAVGALPWLWANADSGLASLTGRGFHASFNSSILGNLSIFFRLSLPMEVGLRRVASGAWLFGNAGDSPISRLLLIVLCVVVFGVVAGSIVMCLKRPNPIRSIGFGLLAFPLIYAASPVTWYWQDGRYVALGGPLLVLCVAVACHEWTGARYRMTRSRIRQPSNRSSGTVLFALAATASIALSIASFIAVTGATPASFAKGWTDPDAPTLGAISILEARGVRDGYADYWVAYKVDFLSGGRLTFTKAGGPAGGEADRSRLIDAVVRRSPRQAWLFVPPPQLAIGAVQFGPAMRIADPGGESETAFISALKRLHVPFRTIHAGVLDAVVPQKPVPPSEVNGSTFTG